MAAEHQFGVLDYILFSLTIIGSLGIGLYYAFSGGRQKTTSEFLVGNRKMKVLPVAISLLVSFESSIMMLGIPAEVYVYGIQWFWSLIGLFVSNLIGIKVLVPLLHPLRITSAYEYLELRFQSRAVRLLGTSLGILSYICYMGVVLFGPAIALEAVTGFPQILSILIVAGASVIYTSLGGIKAVIWTDVFQAFIMFIGVFAILIKGTIDVGGASETWRIAGENGRLNVFNFDPDPRVRHTFWGLMVGSVIKGVGLLFNQSTIQRISSTPTVKDAQKVILIMSPAFMITIGLAGIEGIVAFAYFYNKGCDPLQSKQISNPNQIIPTIVMDIFHKLPGMPGVFLASLFSASLSTLSSGLSSMSAILWADVIKPHTKPMSELKATCIAKLSVVFFGVLSVFVAVLVSYIGGTLNQIAGTIMSAFSGPLAGLFLLGCFCHFANAKGAFLATLLSTALCIWIATGQYSTNVAKRWPKLPPGPTDMCFPDEFGFNATMNNYTVANVTEIEITEWMTSTTVMTTTELPPATGIKAMYTMSYLWLGVVGIFSVIILGAIISLLTGPIPAAEANPLYLISFFDELMCCLPANLRKTLRFGVDFDKKRKFWEGAHVVEDYVLATEKYGITIESKTEQKENLVPNGDSEALSPSNEKSETNINGPQTNGSVDHNDSTYPLEPVCVTENEGNPAINDSKL